MYGQLTWGSYEGVKEAFASLSTVVGRALIKLQKILHFAAKIPNSFFIALRARDKRELYIH